MKAYGLSECLARWGPLSQILKLPILKQAAQAKNKLLNRLGYSKPPANVTFILTNKCNLKCEMCPSWGHLPLTEEYAPITESDHKLTKDEWFSIVDQLSLSKPTILLFGGEPLLESYCVELGAYIRQKGMVCSINTNGISLEERARELVDAQINTVFISIDGPRQIHDKVRGQKGSYDKAVKGILKIGKLKRERKLSLPSLEIIATINVTNQTSLAELVRIAEELPISKLTIQHPMFVTRGILKAQTKAYYSAFSEKQSIAITSNLYDVGNINVNMLIKTLADIQSRKYTIPLEVRPKLSDDEIVQYYRSDTFRPKNRLICHGPWLNTTIFESGDVSPCLIYVTGSVTKEPFGAIWNNKRHRIFRRYFRNNIMPFCARCCMLYIDL